MNVLMIVPDALRSANLGCYSYPKKTSPYIDKLAKEGILFKNAVSTASHTMPAMVSMFTGLDPITHGVDGPKTYDVWIKGKLWKKWKQPFEILKENEYITAGCDQWMYAGLKYVEVKDLKNAIGKYKNDKFFLWWAPYQTHLPYNPKSPYDAMFMPEESTISESTKEKLRIVKSTMIIHKPGLVSKFEQQQAEGILEPATHPRSAGPMTFLEEDKSAIMALYDGEIRSQDEEIEGYIRKLEELGILDDTMVVLTADHGEEIGERGSVGHSSCSLAGTLYDEVVKVPLIIRYPKALPEGKVVETQVSLTDVMPTLFDIMGFETPKETEGHSLMPLTKGDNADFKEEAYLETTPCGWQALQGDERKIYAIRTPKMKLIYNYDPNNKDKCSYELYNLKNDPGEKRNLIYDMPDVANQFKDKLHNWIKKPSFLLNK
ncbi:sulfatase [bacterium]|nr:sulfatase [bacterium]